MPTNNGHSKTAPGYRLEICDLLGVADLPRAYYNPNRVKLDDLKHLVDVLKSHGVAGFVNEAGKMGLPIHFIKEESE